MYFKSLPDHAKPDFDLQSHFSLFKKSNVIFNALSSYSVCDHHVGCLSFKTVLDGEEWYGIGNRQVAVRPGKFLMMNNNQAYSSRIDTTEDVRSLSIFFKEEFASSVFQDLLFQEEFLIDNPSMIKLINPEFIQTLTNINHELQIKLTVLISTLNSNGYINSIVDEHLMFILRDLIVIQLSGTDHINRIKAVKPYTRIEIYKRLCVAKDLIESCYMEQSNLEVLSNASCLSIPQLIRQFKSAFHRTPHQYLIHVRLTRALELLRQTCKPVHEITWMCGFENVSAFSRAFKSEYGMQPAQYRKS